MREELFEQETIDITPTWAGLLPAMLMVLEQGNAKAKQEIKAELQRMARIADLHVASASLDANAIAALPELLDALDFVMRATAEWPGDMSASIDAIRDKATAALDKATGGA